MSADNYLISGDGQHDNPEIATIASLVNARQCEKFNMYFSNRKVERNEEHAKALEEFFLAEQVFNPNYRRIFRPAAHGSVKIDLGDPVDN